MTGCGFWGELGLVAQGCLGIIWTCTDVYEGCMDVYEGCMDVYEGCSVLERIG